MQVVCTLFLIFSMGVLLGSRENFLEELSTLGIQSVIFFLLPSVGSVLLVYPLTRRFLENKKTGKGRKETWYIWQLLRCLAALPAE